MSVFGHFCTVFVERFRWLLLIFGKFASFVYLFVTNLCLLTEPFQTGHNSNIRGSGPGPVPGRLFH